MNDSKMMVSNNDILVSRKMNYPPPSTNTTTTTSNNNNNTPANGVNTNTNMIASTSTSNINGKYSNTAKTPTVVMPPPQQVFLTHVQDNGPLIQPKTPRSNNLGHINNQHNEDALEMDKLKSMINQEEQLKLVCLYSKNNGLYTIKT